MTTHRPEEVPEGDAAKRLEDNPDFLDYVEQQATDPLVCEHSAFEVWERTE